MDDDDPDFEEVVRNYAALSGEDPDELMREEAARRASGGTSRSLDEVLADERAKASEAPAAAPSPPPSPAPRVPSTSSTSSTGGNGAGVLLGMLGYAVLVNFLHGGPAQVRGWMAAKFLNKPYQGGPK